MWVIGVIIIPTKSPRPSKWITRPKVKKRQAAQLVCESVLKVRNASTDKSVWS